MLLCGSLVCGVEASGQLTTHRNAHEFKPGYIDYAVLVVEPHGGYCEQSLYLWYSDHGQFPGSDLVEIAHQFRLPEKALVNDLWLWMGNNIMQAILTDTWTARKTYDSIASSLRDPALLTVSKGVYDLRVYPLLSGSIRKVKISYLVPMTWLGKRGMVELPYTLLNHNNAPVKPLEILFRERDDVWGEPGIQESPTTTFSILKDTNGYTYRHALIDDITPLGGLTLNFRTDFRDRTFFASSEPESDKTCFQFGIDPGALFPNKRDTARRQELFAFDFSGRYLKKLPGLLEQMKQTIHASAHEGDSIRILVAGAHRVDFLRQNAIPAIPDSIDRVIDQFGASEWAAHIQARALPKLFFTDSYAERSYAFPGLDSLAQISTFSDVGEAIRQSTSADIIVTGVQLVPTGSALCDSTRRWLEPFFEHGGKLFTIWRADLDLHQCFPESYFINLRAANLPWPQYLQPTRLTPNTHGDIGPNFWTDPVRKPSFFFRIDSDPLARAELTNNVGWPFLISKRVGNGLLVVSSLYTSVDPIDSLGAYSIPLFGLNEATHDVLLTRVLAAARDAHAMTPFDRVVLSSNTDSLSEAAASESWTHSYLNGFSGVPPVFTTIHFQEGSRTVIRSTTVQAKEYFGCGYLLKTLAESTAGRYFESYSTLWSIICAGLDPQQISKADSFTVNAIADGGAGQVHELREVDPIPADPVKVRFFIGEATRCDSLSLTVRAKFEGIPEARVFTTVGYCTPDPTRADQSLPVMLGNEHLKDILRDTPKDTAAIVRTAMEFRLLCNFTAFIATEPHDSIGFMRNPFDETRLLDVPEIAAPDRVGRDSIAVAVAPNPFRGFVDVSLRVHHASRVTVTVYDRLGRLLRIITSDDPIESTGVYRWSGDDAHMHRAVPGLYYIEIVARDISSGAVRRAVRSALFLH
jgi:hypothetical protein